MSFFQYGALVEQVATTATAAGTTTLVNNSKQVQIFTGTSAQTIVLPNATTMTVGQSFEIFNQSTGTLTLEFNGGAAFTDATGKNYSLLSTLTSITIFLQANGTAAGTWAVVSSSAAGLGAPGPTVQKFLSGSGTYTTPANVSFISVQMVGGGGGGAGSGTSLSGGNGGNGGATTFGTSLLTANGGSGGSALGNNGGAGGSASLGTGPIGVALTGGSGSGVGLSQAINYEIGGSGAASPFGGQGGGGSSGQVGQSAVANTGSGGGGGAMGAAIGLPGSGGGAGGYVNAIIVSPSATYSYSVGAAGTAGTAGTNGNPGGAGGSGVIIVTEYYFNGLGASAGNGGAYTPTVTTLTSGSGTFTTPANASYITVQMVGGGGGGGSSESSGASNTGSTGTTSVFGVSSATGGSGGGGSAGGVGGTGALGSGPTGFTLTGQAGSSTPTSVTTLSVPGGSGGSTVFGGGGQGIIGNNSGNVGVANTGGGGSGAGGTSGALFCGAGGGAGGYVFAIIVNPASSYSYTVGAGGAGGTAGTGGSPGSAGGSGVIIVTTYYNNGAVGTATTITGSANSSQILGTTAGGNPTTGYIGEFISANPASNVSVGSSGSGINVTSITLSAGDWDVSGTISFLGGSTTTASFVEGGISLSSGAIDSYQNGGNSSLNFNTSTNSSYRLALTPRRVNVTTTTTVYLVGLSIYSTNGGAVWDIGSFIQARRVR